MRSGHVLEWGQRKRMDRAPLMSELAHLVTLFIGIR